MEISVIETNSLGDRSYLVSGEGIAAVIDPQRDIDRVLDIAHGLAVTITHVFETHVHNDYVTGGLELSRTLGAQYVVAAGDDLGYERLAVRDGDVIDVGPFAFVVMATPGHTYTHVSYAVRDTTGPVRAVFTGGSMLHGTTGRTDLVGSEHTLDLARAQYKSVRRLAAELSETVQVYPTHGFGSFCAASPASGESSTIADQLFTNPALTTDEDEYVNELISGLTDYPAYYAHMGAINASGPDPIDLSLPCPVEAAEVSRRIAAGEWVVDLRNRTAFARGHLAGSFGFELSPYFATYLGWLYEWGAPLTLIGEDTEQILLARRELSRIGVDNVTGSAAGGIETLAAGRPLAVTRVASFADLAAQPVGHPLTVLDVRQKEEYDEGHVREALLIPLPELLVRRDDVPAGEVWVHCRSGFRASIACSLIERPDRTLVYVDDDFDNAVAHALT